MKKSLKLLIVSMLTLVVLLAVAPTKALFAGSKKEEPKAGMAPVEPTIPEVTVRLAFTPYFDQSWGYIGIEKDWYKDVGIKIEHRETTAENVLGLILAGTVEVGSVPPVAIVSILEQQPGIKNFIYSDFFYGFSIMGKPEFKSYQEFVAEGNAPDVALKKAMEQMRGRTFVFPPEPVPRMLSDTALKKAGMSIDDVGKTVVLEDPKAVALMIAGRADFQIGGVPSHLTLGSKGFKEIVTAFDLAQTAEASPDSVELRAILQNGWAATTKWLEREHDTALRMAAVGYRILRFMNEDPEAALAIHTPFLNSIAGSSFDLTVAKVVYTTLDPFYTFENQKTWYYDKSDIGYWTHTLGAGIKMLEENGQLPEGKYKPADASISDEFYYEFEELKAKADVEMSDAAAAIRNAKDTGADPVKAEGFLNKAKELYGIYDYLDAVTFAAAAKEWAEYEGSK